jgi:hypothetical protein
MDGQTGGGHANGQMGGQKAMCTDGKTDGSADGGRDRDAGMQCVDRWNAFTHRAAGTMLHRRRTMEENASAHSRATEGVATQIVG